MYFACRSIIEFLSPVQATWTSPAFTVVIVLPLSQRRMARSVASRHPRVLRPGRRPADLAHRLAGLLSDVSPAVTNTPMPLKNAIDPTTPIARPIIEQIETASCIASDRDEVDPGGP